ncbi:hypothetical protein [Scleromatobacter humisilvae]|uniref:Uncharacterized protein n=1 Tax=Scleromatobacter humisilvae TaxID=2897159 RepID=A0A9X1YMA5_9BURK|nr:hypothetical protein [Scleromatobacter humisilvae]MCK9688934.1 hypothetical protein [Scleromatobacter humisilvae]
MIHPTRLSTFCPTPAAPARPAARDARTRGRRALAVATCAAVLQAAGLNATAAQARKPRAPKAASTPSTAQILAPSAATVPDALSPDKLIYRCGNTYSSQACANAKRVDVADERSDAQRRQSEELTARDKRLAAWLEAQRHEREAAASAASATRTTRVAKASKECGAKSKESCPAGEPVTRQTRTIAVLAPPSPVAGKSR